MRGIIDARGVEVISARPFRPGRLDSSETIGVPYRPGLLYAANGTGVGEA